MSKFFCNSSSRAKVLNQSKSSFILLLTLFVAVIVACVMFVNKEALAEESVVPNDDPTPLTVYPEDQTNCVNCLGDPGKDKFSGNRYNMITESSNNTYKIICDNRSVTKTWEYQYTGVDKISFWNAQTYWLEETYDFRLYAGGDTKYVSMGGSGYGLHDVKAYIGTNHQYLSSVEGGSLAIDSESKSVNPGTFEAAYGSSYSDLSMSISGNDLTYDTGADGDNVKFLITPVDGYALDKVELWKASNDEPLATVTPEAGATGISEVTDKIVPVFKKLEYIGVSGSVYGNMYEPLEGAVISDITDPTNPSLVATTGADGNFSFQSIKGEAHKFSISDSSGALTPEVFEITAEQAQEDVNAGAFYLVDGAITEIATSGEGFDGVHVIAEKDGTVYYEGPYEGANLTLSEDGKLSVDENGNLIYTYSYTDGEGTTHNYLLTFTPNALEGYHVDSWKINDKTIKFQDDPYVITSDDVDNGLKAEPVMVANPTDPDDPVIPDDPVNPGVEVKATAQTGDNHVAGIFGLTTLLVVAGACALRFRKGN